MRRWGLLPAAVLIFGALLCAPLFAPLFARQSSATGPISATPSQSAPAASQQPAGSAASSSPAPQRQSAPAPVMLIVPTGTRLPLVLHNSITTRNAQPGDPLFLETTFPIVLNDRIVVPAGSYVQGEILEAKRPGKVKGQGEVRVRLTTMILPNGYTVKFDAVPTNAGTGGNESTDGRRHHQGRHRQNQ